MKMFEILAVSEDGSIILECCKCKERYSEKENKLPDHICNPLINDRKHLNEIKYKEDKMFFLYLVLFIGLFAGCVGAVLNAVGK